MEQQTYLEALLNDALLRIIEQEDDVLDITFVQQFPLNSVNKPINVSSKYDVIRSNEDYYRELSETYNFPDVHCEQNRE